MLWVSEIGRHVIIIALYSAACFLLRVPLLLMTRKNNKQPAFRGGSRGGAVIRQEARPLKTRAWAERITGRAPTWLGSPESPGLRSGRKVLSQD